MKIPEPYNTGQKTFLAVLSVLLPTYNEKHKQTRELLRAKEKARRSKRAISSPKLS